MTGRDPEDDDLERVNCPKAGSGGHYLCGWCPLHGPRFSCGCPVVPEVTPDG